MADAGSPDAVPILSISSSITQSRAPALRIVWMMVPGAPYRRRGSRPGRAAAELTRALAPMARATTADEVLPTPGETDETQDRRLAFQCQLAHRQVLDDALSSVFQTSDQHPGRGTSAISVHPSTRWRPRRSSSVSGRSESCRTRRPPRRARGGAAPSPQPHSVDIFASAMAFSRSARSCLLEPSSPSSRWMAAICSRSSTSRWRVSSEALVLLPISADRRSTSRR